MKEKKTIELAYVSTKHPLYMLHTFSVCTPLFIVVITHCFFVFFLVSQFFTVSSTRLVFIYIGFLWLNVIYCQDLYVKRQFSTGYFNCDFICNLLVLSYISKEAGETQTSFFLSFLYKYIGSFPLKQRLYTTLFRYWIVSLISLIIIWCPDLSLAQENFWGICDTNIISFLKKIIIKLIYLHLLQ